MLDFLALMPHGDEVLNPQDQETEELAQLMKDIASKADGIENFVVLSPHSIRIMDQISIIVSEHVSNEKDFLTDRELAYNIYKMAKKEGLPVVAVNFGALEGSASRIPLDWGTSIPLSFFSNIKNIVVISPAREIERTNLVKFGNVLGKSVDQYNKNYGIIVSADQAHAHLENGPYGYSKYAEIYDKIVIESFKNNKIDDILKIDEEIIEAAKPDSFWQILVLIGILKYKSFKVKGIKYSRPTYFGMMAAEFVKNNVL